jgi:hypothetical protein
MPGDRRIEFLTADVAVEQTADFGAGRAFGPLSEFFENHVRGWIAKRFTEDVACRIGAIFTGGWANEWKNALTMVHCRASLFLLSAHHHLVLHSSLESILRCLGSAGQSETCGQKEENSRQITIEQPGTTTGAPS